VDSVTELTLAQIAMIAGGAIALVAYSVFILAPAWVSYGRLWERVAAAFLTVFMLATLVGVGAGMGVAIVWSYDRF
jgi:hypothetical protein